MFLFVLDTKNSVGVGPSNVDEISHNAVVVRWNPRNSQVRVCQVMHYSLSYFKQLFSFATYC